MPGVSKEIKKITILYFNLFTWLGGGEFSVFHLVNNLDHSKYNPLMLFNKDGPFVEKVKAAGIETVIIPFAMVKPTSLLKLQNIIKNWKASFKILNLIRDRHIDIVQCSDVYALLLLIPSLLRSRLKVIYNQIIFYSILRYWLFNFLTLLFIDRIVATSNIIKTDLLKKTLCLKNRTNVIYNGVDSSVFYPRDKSEKIQLRTKFGLPSDKFLIGFVGRFEVWKGHITFLEAAQILLKKHKDLFFLIVGGAITQEVAPQVSRYRDVFFERFHKAKLADHILILDQRDDIPEIMSALDVFVCPSDYEPFGLVVLEALASGVPVVLSDTVGALEIVKEFPNVYIAETKNAQSFANQVIKALEDNTQNHYILYTEKYNSQLTWSKYTRQYEELYASISKYKI